MKTQRTIQKEGTSSISEMGARRAVKRLVGHSKIVTERSFATHVQGVVHDNWFDWRSTSVDFTEGIGEAS